MHTGVSTATSLETQTTQEPFSRVTPLLKAALLIGAAGGFVLATILTLTSAFSVPLGMWWTALAQAHGHLQLYGWAGLFVLGVAFHFLPRLRGTPLIAARFLPFLLITLVTSLLLRTLSQPLLTLNLGWQAVWGGLLIGSGVLEVLAFVGALLLLAITAVRGPRPTSRPAYWGVFPLLFGVFASFVLASVVNLFNTMQAATGVGLILDAGDTLNITLGLFGFLVPMALAMSARSLPMYAGLDAFPRRVLWPVAYAYFIGLLLFCLGTLLTLPSIWSNLLLGCGMLLLGGVIVLFIVIFMRMMRTRGRLPKRVEQLATEPQKVAQRYQQQVKNEQNNYGPFVALVASSYIWALLGGLLLLLDGGAVLFGQGTPVSLDAVRHSFAIGFIALLICGIAPRMLPGFSGHTIASPKLVSATLWCGNIAALLRVCSIIFAPLLAMLHAQIMERIIFGLSGPFGLALALCLAINLWPALRTRVVF